VELLLLLLHVVGVKLLLQHCCLLEAALLLLPHGCLLDVLLLQDGCLFEVILLLHGCSHLLHPHKILLLHSCPVLCCSQQHSGHAVHLAAAAPATPGGAHPDVLPLALWPCGLLLVVDRSCCLRLPQACCLTCS
jgi:hypothetical protein